MVTVMVMMTIMPEYENDALDEDSDSNDDDDDGSDDMSMTTMMTMFPFYQ